MGFFPQNDATFIFVDFVGTWNVTAAFGVRAYPYGGEVKL